ncbi:lipid A deacylase LpxR family protein [Desertivirga xinjiangensis]|uniref:lipid A deacylase LpxR family protein n=1 Tax=Desertivirga xinjiangensis TaxID=539206 RepID=UPI002108A309|nr:lipid A deacylase LpxR family protein [Pedobacter xinjiangensis]
MYEALFRQEILKQVQDDEELTISGNPHANTTMKIIYFYLTIFLLLPGLSYSQQENFRNEFGFRSDNDAYLAMGQDRYYTNGLFITFRHALREKYQEGAKKIWEAELGQYLYNAVSGNIPSLNLVDRPFAAYLYTGFKMNWFKGNEDHFQAGLQIGTIGPAAYGREIQQTLHDIVGFYEIRGWEYQVKNEVGINSSFGFNKLLVRGGNNDLSLRTYANLGNTFTGAGAGLLYRTGNINKFFKSVSDNSRISNSLNDSIPRKEAFFYARPMLNFIAYNASLQGGMFKEDKGPVVFTPNRLLFAQELGVMYAKNRWSLNFSVIFQSKELKEQRKAHQYGSASIFYRFN